MKKWIVATFDRYVGCWFNVWFNVGLGVVMGVGALFIESWARDVWFLAAGANFGYAFMWLTYPRFTKARQREMEAQMALIAASTLCRLTRETLGSVAQVVAEEDLEKRRLQ